MVPFGGWEMPLSYPDGTIAEHLACRNSAVAFDVSHLGTVRLQGPGSLGRLQATLTNDLGKIGPGRAQYTHLLDEADASVLDDIIVWWVDEERFDVMPNASNTSRVRAAIGGEDITGGRAVIAVQGPDARRRLATVSAEAAAVGRFRVTTFTWDGIEVTAAGTGYTGEDGVECSVPVAAAEAFWSELLAAGVTPAGLGARAPSGWSPLCPSTATSSVPASHHCRPGWAGWWPGTSLKASAGATPSRPNGAPACPGSWPA
jgi:aminomethyltransferase